MRGPRALRVCLDDAAVRADAAAVRAAVVARVTSARADVVECDVTALDAADAAAVDALARLQLAVRRSGAAVVLHGADARLCAVIRLLGLADVLLATEVATGPGSGAEGGAAGGADDGPEPAPRTQPPAPAASVVETER